TPILTLFPYTTLFRSIPSYSSSEVLLLRKLQLGVVLMFNKNKLSHAILVAAASSSLSVPVWAQQEASRIEEVYVSGIRASLERAMDIKRDAGGLVDAISAEDIGKVPAAHLAESLQWLPGVSTDRNAGAGTSVSVRGFGPNHNMVTTYARQMPSSGDGRGFNINDLAAEL